VSGRAVRRAAAAATALAGLVLGPAAPAGAAGVLVIGDSLSVGTRPYLQRDLPGVPIRFDVEIGRPSPAGVGLLARELRPDDQVVVFDLGTNDAPSEAGILAADLAAARREAGARCLVVATLNRPPVGGVSVADLNRAVRAFAASDPNVLVVPWHAEVRARPEYLGADRIHATQAGYAARGRVFAQAVSTCLLTGAPPPLPRLPVAPAVHVRSRTIAPAAAPAPAPGAQRARARARERERERLYGTMAALVGRLVDVVAGNLMA
jgi:hypothetical protein